MTAGPGPAPPEVTALRLPRVPKATGLSFSLCSPKGHRVQQGPGVPAAGSESPLPPPPSGHLVSAAPWPQVRWPREAGPGRRPPKKSRHLPPPPWSRFPAVLLLPEPCRRWKGIRNVDPHSERSELICPKSGVFKVTSPREDETAPPPRSLPASPWGPRARGVQEARCGMALDRWPGHCLPSENRRCPGAEPEPPPRLTPPDAGGRPSPPRPPGSASASPRPVLLRQDLPCFSPKPFSSPITLGDLEVPPRRLLTVLGLCSPSLLVSHTGLLAVPDRARLARAQGLCTGRLVPGALVSPTGGRKLHVAIWGGGAVLVRCKWHPAPLPPTPGSHSTDVFCGGVNCPYG